jgi:hypothetical protein
MQQRCAGRLERNSLTVAFDADGSPEHKFGWRVVLLAGVAARDNSVGRGISANHAMEQNAVLTESERDIAAPQIVRVHRLRDYRIAVQDVRLHALPVRKETHLQTTLQDLLAQHRELRRITPQ